MAVKIAVVGAGSIGFTRKLMADVLCVPELADTTFALTDISKQNLDMITQLARRDLKANNVPAKIVSTTNRKRAFEGADYVINVVRVGGLEGFRTDVDIPLKYGVDQCVADTLCAGGIMYGQRNIPVILDFCDDILEVGAEDCLLLSHANPNAMNTWAANHFGSVPTIGLCHGVAGGHWQITDVIGRAVNKGKEPGSKGYVEVTKEDVDIIAAGINHQTWYIQVRYGGEDWTGRLLEGFESHPVFKRTEKVRVDLLRRFGYYTTESNGHVSEYVPWYRKREKNIKNWIDMSSWINGETGGYLRVCTEGRDWFETDFPNWLKAEPPEFTPEKRGHEHTSYIIEGLETGRVYRGHFNVPNEGCIANLPDDAIVEVPGYVDRNGVNIPKVGDLPLGCAAVCNASISVQRLAVEAAVYGDYDLLVQAMMMDPLTGAVCEPPEIAQMVDEMLVAQAQWLPQYKSAIAAARKRLAGGGRIKTRKGYKGAARVKTKTVAEMRKNAAAARKSAQEADKAAAKRKEQMSKAAARK